MRLSQDQVDRIMNKFLAGLDPDERAGLATTAPAEIINREISHSRRPDAEDVAEAMWEVVPGLEDLDEEHRYDLVDVIEDFVG